MKRIVVILSVVVCAVFGGLLGAPAVRAQDAVKVDAKHYTVMLENDQVRVLKVRYGAGEKSAMHSHPNSVAVFLSDAKVRFNFPDGKSKDVEAKAGDAVWNDAVAHLPEN